MSTIKENFHATHKFHTLILCIWLKFLLRRHRKIAPVQAPGFSTGCCQKTLRVPVDRDPALLSKAINSTGAFDLAVSLLHCPVLFHAAAALLIQTPPCNATEHAKTMKCSCHFFQLYLYACAGKGRRVVIFYLTSSRLPGAPVCFQRSQERAAAERTSAFNWGLGRAPTSIVWQSG